MDRPKRPASLPQASPAPTSEDEEDCGEQPVAKRTRPFFGRWVEDAELEESIIEYCLPYHLPGGESSLTPTRPKPPKSNDIATLSVVPSTLTSHLRSLALRKPLSKAGIHILDISAFIDTAVAHEERGGQPLLFTFTKECDGYNFRFNIDDPIPDDDEFGVVPTPPAGFNVNYPPLELFCWPSVFENLVALPPDDMTDLDERVCLVNKQVEYWTHQAFCERIERSWPQLSRDRRIFMVRYWLWLSGQSELYTFMRAFRNVKTRDHLDTFETFLSNMREELEDAFLEYEGSGGSSKYSGDCHAGNRLLRRFLET